MAPYSTVAALIGIVFFIVFPNTVFGTEYLVGGSYARWGYDNSPPEVDYQAWANSITFYQGDAVTFNYNPYYHDIVLPIYNSDFYNCNLEPNNGRYTSGVDTFYLNGGNGIYCFMCSAYCQSGMKFCIQTS